MKTSKLLSEITETMLKARKSTHKSTLTAIRRKGRRISEFADFCDENGLETSVNHIRLGFPYLGITLPCELTGTVLSEHGAYLKRKVSIEGVRAVVGLKWRNSTWGPADYTMYLKCATHSGPIHPHAGGRYSSVCTNVRNIAMGHFMAGRYRSVISRMVLSANTFTVDSAYRRVIYKKDCRVCSTWNNPKIFNPEEREICSGCQCLTCLEHMIECDYCHNRFCKLCLSGNVSDYGHTFCCQDCLRYYEIYVA